MKQLFENDFISTYGIITKGVKADEYRVPASPFDLDDTKTPPVVTIGSGQASFFSTVDIDVLAYDRFLNKCKKPVAVINTLGNRCDFLLTSHSDDSLVCLAELTSAYSTSNNLVMLDPKTGISKIQKVEMQLANSLEVMLRVPAIAGNFKTKKRKICLMTYIVYSPKDNEDRIKHPFARFLEIEARETKNEGALLSSARINANGFEYRRISHDYTFTL